ncbi:hypothetical protein LSTR_LSTR008730 [Laodelphax striatellus]|uniref:SCP domain-containing protein n=1 Tax=Laodelphax striatellus TaxID=195883 RepID=A0A482XQ64_LAOST|nr:hypothetical protein LSTR_LSTR008730 [Laodelphax striatellus]
MTGVEILLGSLDPAILSRFTKLDLFESGGLSCQEKDSIVSLHNTLRQRVALGSVSGQPPAANMLEMAWDEELARKAQSWADSCPAGHDSNYARRVGRFSVGQNIAKTWSSSGRSYAESPNFSSQINAWFSEVYHYSFGRGGAGHYSQMVWGDSHLVGCGYTQYVDGTRNTKMYVCNYGPGGNVVGKSPYRPGPQSCAQIGASPSRKYSGLCELPGTSSSSCYGGGGGGGYGGYSEYSGGYSGYSGYSSYYGGYRKRFVRR